MEYMLTMEEDILTGTTITHTLESGKKFEKARFLLKKHLIQTLKLFKVFYKCF